MGSINVCTIGNQNQAKPVLCRTLSSRQPVISFTTPCAKEIGRANFATSMDGTSAHCISNTLLTCSTPLWVEYKTFQQKNILKSVFFFFKVIINPADENSKKIILAFSLPGFQISVIYSDILLFGAARNCELPNLKFLQQLHVQLLINHFQLQRLHQPTTGVGKLSGTCLTWNLPICMAMGSYLNYISHPTTWNVGWLFKRFGVWGRATHRSPAYQ